MLNDLPGILVVRVRPAYAYRETEGPLSGMMVETHLDQEFLAGTYLEGLDGAIAWARERERVSMSELYPGSFLSSIKVSLKYIGRVDTEGVCSTRSTGVFFEWKYDFPGTLDGSRGMWVTGHAAWAQSPINS